MRKLLSDLRLMKRLRNIINDNLASIDGQIPIWMFRTIHGHPPINKISGSDLIYSIPEYAESKGLKVFLLGGNEKATMVRFKI